MATLRAYLPLGDKNFEKKIGPRYYSSVVLIVYQVWKKSVTQVVFLPIKIYILQK